MVRPSRAAAAARVRQDERVRAGMNYLAGFYCACTTASAKTTRVRIGCLSVTEDMFGISTRLKTLRAIWKSSIIDFRACREAHDKLQSMGLAAEIFHREMVDVRSRRRAGPSCCVCGIALVDADRQPRETLLRCSLAILALQAPFIRAAE